MSPIALQCAALHDGFFYVDANERGELIMKRHVLQPLLARDFATLPLAVRIAGTQRAIEARSPMMERWSRPTESWNVLDGRATLAAQFLTGCGSVTDLGCGAMRLEAHLSPSQDYIPVDLVARDERTRVINLDDASTPLPKAEACAVLGVLECLYDTASFIARLAHEFPRAVVSYHPSGGNEEHRLGQGWVNSLTAAQLNQIFAEAGFVIERAIEAGTGEVLYSLRSARCAS